MSATKPAVLRARHFGNVQAGCARRMATALSNSSRLSLWRGESRALVILRSSREWRGPVVSLECAALTTENDVMLVAHLVPIALAERQFRLRVAAVVVDCSVPMVRPVIRTGVWFRRPEATLDSATADVSRASSCAALTNTSFHHASVAPQGAGRLKRSGLDNSRL